MFTNCTPALVLLNLVTDGRSQVQAKCGFKRIMKCNYGVVQAT